MNLSHGQGNQINGEQDYIRIFRDIGIPLITLGAGVFSANFIVGSWQKGKDLSDLKKEILSDYAITFKNYVILMETFVLKLVMEFVKTGNDPNKPKLSDVMPFEYTYRDLNLYAKTVRESKFLLDFGKEPLPEGKTPYSKEQVAQRLENLYNEINNCYIDFRCELLSEFRKNNESKFKEQFYNISDITMRFSARLTQYYQESKILYEEFSVMWEYMMGCYVVVNKILDSKTEEEFIVLLKNYLNYVIFLFDIMLYFEQKLISKNLTLGNSKQKKESPVTT